MPALKLDFVEKSLSKYDFLEKSLPNLDFLKEPLPKHDFLEDFFAKLDFLTDPCQCLILSRNPVYAVRAASWISRPVPAHARPKT